MESPDPAGENVDQSIDASWPQFLPLERGEEHLFPNSKISQYQLRRLVDEFISYLEYDYTRTYGLGNEET